MKIYPFLALPVALLLFSCGGEESTHGDSAGQEEKSTVDKVADSVKSAGDAASDWTRSAGNWMAKTWDSLKKSSAENTEKAQESLNELAKELGTQIDLAQDKAAELTGAAKVQANKGIEGLKKARDEIVDASSRVANATAEQWPAIQKEVAEAWDQAGESMQTIWSAVSENPDEAGPSTQTDAPDEAAPQAAVSQ